MIRRLLNVFQIKNQLGICTTNHANAESPNEKDIHKTVWGKLNQIGLSEPSDLYWYNAIIEADDLLDLYVIGSSDWKKTFGTYNISDIAEITKPIDNDGTHHIPRIGNLTKTYLTQGNNLSRPLFVSPSKKGPFVCIDGK